MPQPPLCHGIDRLDTRPGFGSHPSRRERGLSNSERVGTRLHRPPVFAGTINTLVHVAQPLSDAALIEAISIATEARTTAVLDAGVERAGLTITGTGTDCIAIAAPLGDNAACYAGKHTAIGEAIGAAVYEATADGIRDWKTDCIAPGEVVSAEVANS
ncbi:MAG: adenosylcobinamide amidohydrolase [Hyphomicrobium sp.]